MFLCGSSTNSMLFVYSLGSPSSRSGCPYQCWLEERSDIHDIRRCDEGLRFALWRHEQHWPIPVNEGLKLDVSDLSELEADISVMCMWISNANDMRKDKTRICVFHAHGDVLFGFFNLINIIFWNFYGWKRSVDMKFARLSPYKRKDFLPGMTRIICRWTRESRILAVLGLLCVYVYVWICVYVSWSDLFLFIFSTVHASETRGHIRPFVWTQWPWVSVDDRETNVYGRVYGCLPLTNTPLTVLLEEFCTNTHNMC